MRIKTGTKIVEVKSMTYLRSWEFGKYEAEFFDYDGNCINAKVSNEDIECLFVTGCLDIS